MYKFLKRNKEWLFSGIGVVILVGVFSLLKSIILNPNSDIEKQYNIPIPLVSQTSDTSSKLYSPVTLQEIHSVLNDETITKLQRQNFLKKHEGRFVRWEGVVKEVTQLFSKDKDGNSDILVIYSPVFQKEKTLPDLYSASFPSTAKDDLSSLSEGDYIEFEGKLDISSLETSPSISLNNCFLLRHEKMKNSE